MFPFLLLAYQILEHLIVFSSVSNCIPFYEAMPLTLLSFVFVAILFPCKHSLQYLKHNLLLLKGEKNFPWIVDISNTGSPPYVYS